MPAAAGAPGATAACGRSEDSAGHTPLQKRGPHLCKRPPLAHPEAGPPRPPGGLARGRARRRLAGARGAAAPLGRAAAQAPGARACTTPDSGGIADTRPARPPSRPATHPEPTPQNRANPRRRPTPPSASRPTRNPPTRPLPSASPRPFTHRLSQHTRNPLITHCPCPVAAAPPRATSTRLGWPARFTWRVEEGGPAQPRWPPFLESPGGKRKTGRGRGGGLFALKTNPYRRTPRDEQRETNSLGVMFLVSASEDAGARRGEPVKDRAGERAGRRAHGLLDDESVSSTSTWRPRGGGPGRAPLQPAASAS
jgi:hypothetical protein